MAYRSHDSEVVRDENDRQARLNLNRLQQLQHLFSGRAVERRDGFVADQYFRFKYQCARDRHALRLPTGKLVWKTIAIGGVQTNTFQHLYDIGCALSTGHRWRVYEQRFAYDIHHPHLWV